MLTYTHGNNVGNVHFVWKVPDYSSEAFSQSLRTIEKAKEFIPVFHTRSMRNALMAKYGRVAPTMKKCIMRKWYRDLTGDTSGASNTHEAEIDERVRLIFEMEDPTVVLDLRALNTGAKTQYDSFWEECQKFLDEGMTSVDDRRHCQVTHLAKAISVRDLREQVKARCPEGIKIPSESWLRLQFWPKSHHSHSKIHYTGKLKVKFMIQARQFRKSHPDSHYAAAIFRYQREFAVRFKSYSNFICLDDKHRAKVGEPKFPVAAVERGRRVIVGLNSSMEVGDHDFTRFSVIPSVCFIVDIPDVVDESWYGGQVVVGVKDSAFEASSPIRHSTELCNIMTSKSLDTKPILFLYTDGGPDHRLTFLSVQLSLIACFLRLDLDFLCVCRTAPFHSWRNPVERIMSVLNLGMQSIGLMRKEMDDSYESIIARCNSVSQVRTAAEKDPSVKENTLDSIAPVKILMSNIFTRLKLKGKGLECYSAATETEIEDILNSLLSIDDTVSLDKKWVKATLQKHPKLVQYLEHCCHRRHYVFCIKKCGKPDCEMCKPPRLPCDVFDEIKNLPDPIPDTNGHYKSFESVYGTVTAEEHRPSLKSRPSRAKSLPFVASIQHARNTNLMVQCEECEMWRLIYSRHKLTSSELKQVTSSLEDYTYTCGASFSDLGLQGRLAEVCVRDVQCYSPLEKLYYALNKEQLCIYCCSNSDLTAAEGCYLQCVQCTANPNISKRT